jgi:tRNA nucleotidyltransferase (CCA-adding enzyme)
MKNKSFTIPSEVSYVTNTLEKAGFEAYLIGGCVRDLFLGRNPKDWDVTTNAKPEEIIGLFPNTFYENNYGTVGVVNENTTDEKLKVVEVTPYRLESIYSDSRRPDHVTFSKDLMDDLKRRDFTINAIALDSKKDIVDPFKGQIDIKDKIIRAVGDADERFKEDALRMMRAVRIATELGFTINMETMAAIQNDADLLQKISKERIRDEFIRVIQSDEPAAGIEMLYRLGLLKYIVPELEVARGVEQPQAHAYDVWEHLMRTLQHAADKKWPLHVRLAALFHDIGKPPTQKKIDDQWTFYGHEVVGAKMTKRILTDLKFPKEIIDKVTTLVRWHMFFADTEQITLSAVRRLISNVGKDMIWDLINVRICDRIGTGRPKENPYRLRKYQSMIEEALRDPVTVGMLKIDGTTLIKKTGITPGPKIGFILHALLEEVLESPMLNTEDYLEKKAQELASLSEKELKNLGQSGKEKRDQEEGRQLDEIRKKHWVK